MDKNTKHIAMAAGVLAIVAAIYLFSKKDDAPRASNALPPITPPPAPPSGVEAGYGYVVAAPFDALGLTTGMYRTFQPGDKISVIGKVGTVTTLTDMASPLNLYTTGENVRGSVIGA